MSTLSIIFEINQYLPSESFLEQESNFQKKNVLISFILFISFYHFATDILPENTKDASPNLQILKILMGAGITCP